VVPVCRRQPPLSRNPRNGVAVGTRAGRRSRLPTGNEPLWADLGRTCHTSKHPKPGFKHGLRRQRNGRVSKEFLSLVRQTLGIDERASPNGVLLGRHHYPSTHPQDAIGLAFPSFNFCLWVCLDISPSILYAKKNGFGNDQCHIRQSFHSLSVSTQLFVRVLLVLSNGIH
jgi:hypothetical protein